MAIYGQDENTVAMFRLIAGFCFLIAIALAIVSWWRPVSLLGTVLIGSMGAVGIASCRYAIIFTPTEFVIRPQFAAHTRILYSSITRLTKTTISTGRYGGRVDAVILQLPFGQTYLLRLNVGNAQQMLERLHQVTGKQIK